MIDRAVLYVATLLAIIYAGAIIVESVYSSYSRDECEALDGVFLSHEMVCLERGAILDMRTAK